MDRGAALKYKAAAPEIVAVAKGKILAKMIEIAEEYNIPVVKDEDLAEILSEMDPGREVPVELFTAVVKVFALCYEINEDFRKKIYERNETDIC